MKRLPPHFSSQLKYHRTRLGWTQEQLAKGTGIPRRLISQFECRERAAKPDQAAMIGHVLRFSPGVTKVVSRRCSAAEGWTEYRVYVPPADRPFRVRLKEARSEYPKLTKELERQICLRPDRDDVIAFLQDTPCDSSLEAVGILKILAAGAQTGYVSPGQLGYYGEAIIEPEYRRPVVGHARPALCLGDVILFPQACYQLTRVIRLDLLICRRSGQSGVTWSFAELDGHGHKDKDDCRSRLSHPVLHYSTSEVLRIDFLDRLTSRRAA